MRNKSYKAVVEVEDDEHSKRKRGLGILTEMASMNPLTVGLEASADGPAGDIKSILESVNVMQVLNLP